MNKGFTIVELIAAIVILSLIFLLVIPAVTGVANTVRRHNHYSKVRSIEQATLSFATQYLLDEIKPAGVSNCSGSTNCCRQYDLYDFIVHNGIYSYEASREINGVLRDIIIDSRTGSVLYGCVRVRYNLNNHRLEAQFVDVACANNRAVCDGWD